MTSASPASSGALEDFWPHASASSTSGKVNQPAGNARSMKRQLWTSRAARRKPEVGPRWPGDHEFVATAARCLENRSRGSGGVEAHGAREDARARRVVDLE